MMDFRSVKKIPLKAKKNSIKKEKYKVEENVETSD
jgi:hypothetical protein